jgi:ElaB/YqjD/DUF883 family membrane-anchored ribosome-binding protein
MSTRDKTNRATSQASEARRELDRAAEDLEHAGEHAGDAAHHAREALKASASGTLERTRDMARETGKKAGHVAEHMSHAQPDRELERRADRTTEKVLDKTGQALRGAAPTIRKGVETTVGAAGSALHAAGGPLGMVMGKIAGKVGGWWSSASEAKAEYSKEEEQLCARHFEAYEAKPAGLTFDVARTAYQIGYIAAENPDYRERDFDEVEADLRHGFTAEPSQEYNALRDFARFGYERAMVIRLPEDEDRVTFHGA